MSNITRFPIEKCRQPRSEAEKIEDLMVAVREKNTKLEDLVEFGDVIISLANVLGVIHIDDDRNVNLTFDGYALMRGTA